jgi:hypothetical protein
VQFVEITHRAPAGARARPGLCAVSRPERESVAASQILGRWERSAVYRTSSPHILHGQPPGARQRALAVPWGHSHLPRANEQVGGHEYLLVCPCRAPDGLYQRWPATGHQPRCETLESSIRAKRSLTALAKPSLLLTGRHRGTAPSIEYASPRSELMRVIVKARASLGGSHPREVAVERTGATACCALQ